jgi:hypothetical protein
MLLAAVALLLAFGSLLPSFSEASPAPVLTARAQTLKWTIAGKRRTYRLATRSPGRLSVTTVTTRTLTPRAVPGATVYYRVKAAYNESGWSNRVSITYPRPGEEPPPPPEEGGGGGGGGGGPPPEEPPAPSPSGMVVGLSAGGWGASAWGDVGGAVRSVRLASRFATDSEVGAAAGAGVSVGSWLFGEEGSIGSIDAAGYAAQVVGVFRRYGRGGTFWAGRPDLGSTAFELLNEPGNPYFWSDPGNYAAYVALSRTVHAALEAAFPAAIRPKMLVSYDGGFAGSEYGRAIFRAGVVADGVTVHPYGGKSSQTRSAEGNRERVVQAHAETGLPVYVTEVGWPTAVGQPATGDSLQWSEAQQAENIKNFISWTRSTGYVAMVDIFNYIDYGSNNWYGIERTNRTHKTSYTTLAEASGASRAASVTPTSPETPPPVPPARPEPVVGLPEATPPTGPLTPPTGPAPPPELSPALP